MNSKMKTITLFFFIVFGMNLTANAQITKGNWMVGGDAFYSSTTNKFPGNEFQGASTDKIYEIRINPNVGYFFIDKLAAGLQLNTVYNKFDASDGGGLKNYGYGLSPFMRYYILDVDKLVNVFIQANYSLRFGEKYDKDNAIDGNAYGLQAGTVFFFNQSVGLELSLKYTSSKDQSSGFKANNLMLGLGFQIHLEK